MSVATESRMLEVLSRIEEKVDDQGTRLARIEGAIWAVENLQHEDRLRMLEISSEGLHVRLGLWGGLAGLVSFVGTVLYALI